jgi:tetratricopeptide (TPR) repeat protein
LLVAAVGMMHQLSPRRFARSRELIEEAVRRRPHSAEAHAWLGEWYLLSIFNGWSADVTVDTAKARDCTARALDLDPEDSFSLTIDGAIANNLLQRLDIAENRFETAIGINPNESMSWLLRGVLRAYADRGDEAVEAVEKARMLSPLDPLGYFYDSLAASAYVSAGKFEQALALADRSYAKNQNHISTLRARICALHYLGRRKEAKAVGAELMRRRPTFTVRSYLRAHPAAQFRFGQNLAKAMRAAGVPD